MPPSSSDDDDDDDSHSTIPSDDDGSHPASSDDDDDDDGPYATSATSPSLGVNDDDDALETGGEEEAAATNIQAHYRGHNQHKIYAKLQEERRNKVSKFKLSGHHFNNFIIYHFEYYFGRKYFFFVLSRNGPIFTHGPGEQKVRREKQEKAAAVAIQAGYRGHMAKTEATSKRAKMEADRKHKAAVSIQSAVRSQKAREQKRTLATEKQRQQQADEKANLTAAATTIQARARGNIARLQTEDKKREDAEKLQAADKIQAHYRGNKQRANYAEQKALAERLRQEKEKEQKKREAAAEAIQAGYRAHMTEMDHAKSKHEKAISIQSAVRSQQARKLKERLAAERDADAQHADLVGAAAVRIQTAERARAAKKEAAGKRHIKTQEEFAKTEIQPGVRPHIEALEQNTRKAADAFLKLIRKSKEKDPSAGISSAPPPPPVDAGFQTLC